MSAVTRQIAVILFSDIAGYTSLMGKDADKALNLVKQSKDIQKPLVKKYRGTWLKDMGDGMMAQFQSAIDAVNCAIEIQRTSRADFEGDLRIGIHLGDVVEEDGDILGDGVNIASRLEGIADPGGIFISESVEQAIRGQTEVETLYLGEKTLKNVDYGIRTYAIQGVGLPVPQKSYSRTRRKSRVKILVPALIVLLVIISFIGNSVFTSKDESLSSDRKSIAVLPFANLSDDADQQYFSDGIHEDILNQLSKIGDIKVKSRTSTLQYRDTQLPIPEIGADLGVSTILEGSVRKAGNKVRITAQLIDVKKDEHIWSETYDRELTEVFAVQSEVAFEIVRILEATLTKGERENLSTDSKVNISAYDSHLKARKIIEEAENEEQVRDGIRVLQQAIDADPNYAPAYQDLGWVLFNRLRWYGVPNELWIDSAAVLFNKALAIDSSLVNAYLGLSDLYNRIGETKLANQYLNNVLELAPNNPSALERVSNKYFEEGKYDEGAELYLKSLDLQYSPKDIEFYMEWGELFTWIGDVKRAEELYLAAYERAPESPFVLRQLGFFYRGIWGRFEPDYDKAMFYLKRSNEQDSNSWGSLDNIGWTHFRLGNYKNAEKYWKKILDVENETSDTTARYPFRHRVGHALWLHGKKEEAMEWFNESIRMNLENMEHVNFLWTPAYHDLAGVYAFLGDREKAYYWLEESAKQKTGDGWFGMLLPYDPLFDSIRNEPRFIEIFERRNEPDLLAAESIRRALARMEANNSLNIRLR